MLTRPLTLLPLALLVGACGSTSATSADPRPPATFAPTPTPTVSLPADADVFHGGTAKLIIKRKNAGWLRVEVETVTRASGSRRTDVTYTKYGGCHVDPVGSGAYAGACDVEWTVKRQVKPDVFTVDPTFDTATFSDTLKGKAVRVQWVGYGETRRQENANGNLLVEWRDAQGTMRWGSDSFTDRKGTENPASLYRRIPQPKHEP